MPDSTLTEASDAALSRLDHARRRMEAALLASAHFLEEPFTNAPETNPWERSVKPAMYALREAIAAVKADSGAAYAAGREAAAQAIEAGVRAADAHPIRAGALMQAAQIARGDQ
jgi:hypothetical protein